MKLVLLILCLQLFFSHKHHFVESYSSRHYKCSNQRQKQTSDESDEKLRKYLQPNDIGRNVSFDNLNHKNEYLCTRSCAKYPRPRICYYVFNVEIYHAMGPACKNCSELGKECDCFGKHCIPANGIERQVYSINRMIPGPAIDVCRGDRIIVDVINKMSSDPITIHWHGLYQKDSPWMDGVPFVTQCPIHPNNVFRYDFKALTNGTLFYHSHIGASQANGVYGSLTVRLPRGDENSNLTDYDLPSHHVLIADWNHFPSDIYIPGYHKNQSHFPVRPHAYLINGLGRHRDSVTQKTNMPLASFAVDHGYKYRFRIIAGTTSTCAFKFGIQKHPMTVVALDGFPCDPFEVDALVMASGQRTDVVINANQTGNATYWILVEGVTRNCNGTRQAAYLFYDDSSSKPNNPPPFANLNEKSRYLNNIEQSCNDSNNICSDRLTAPSSYIAPQDRSGLWNRAPNVSIDMVASNTELTSEQLTDGYNNFHIPNGEKAFVSVLNNVSGLFPPAPLLTQGIPRDFPICDKSGCKNKTAPFCRCLHLVKIKLKSVVDITFKDEAQSFGLHPIHIHGHHFIVMPVGNITPFKNAAERIERDTVFVPLDGKTTIRFVADNPGYWLMHCHFHAHLEGGMHLIFKVGEDEEILKAPANFPKCGHFTPPI